MCLWKETDILAQCEPFKIIQSIIIVSMLNSIESPKARKEFYVWWQASMQS